MTDKNVSIMNIGSMGYLPQVFKKIENEKKLNIVYLGGSKQWAVMLQRLS